MSRRTKYTTEEKYAILNEYDNGIGTMKEIASKYGVQASFSGKYTLSFRLCLLIPVPHISKKI